MIALPNIASAVTHREAEVLTDLARGKDVLELGCDFGFSAVVMARVARHVDTIDSFKYVGHEGAEQVAHENLALEGVTDAVTIHKGDFADVVPALRSRCTRGWGLVFVDGVHDYQSVRADAELALSVLERAGVIAFHDFGRFDVAPVVREFVAGHRGLRLVEVVETLAVVTR